MTRIGVIGVGQTVYRRRHSNLNSAELARQAIKQALLDADIPMNDVGLVVGGVAPDALAGINHIDRMSIARPRIPYFRVNTGGATGSSALLAAISWIRAGRCDVALVVAVERMGHAEAAAKIFNSIFDPIYEKDISLSTISMVALRATLLMQMHGYTLGHWAGLAARNSLNSLKNDTIENPRSFTVEEVLKSGILSWPIHRLEACPTSEGACALLIASDRVIGSRSAAWIGGAHGLSDTYAMGDRMHRKEGTLVDLVTLRRAAAKAYADAGVTRPADEIDAVEIQAPFASSEVMAYAALGLCQAEAGPAFVDRLLGGQCRIGINPSGGPQAVNPVSATALIRIAECALQVRGKAGERQLDDIRRTVATGQGGATQFSTAVILQSARP